MTVIIGDGNKTAVVKKANGGAESAPKADKTTAGSTKKRGGKKEK